jgi:hypothetical protein
MRPSRRIALTWLAAALACAPLARATAMDAALYVPGTEDVPLMPGLAPADDSLLVFDQPQGRIVEASASGPVRRRDVIAFYRASLPELGWAVHGRHAFERAGERLSLDFDGRDGQLTVAFTLVPG